MIRWIVKAARHVKEWAEWYGIFAAAGLVPTATFIAGVVNDAPADILLLYVTVAVAFGFVIVAELPAVIRQLHRPKLVLEYTRACCLKFDDKWSAETVSVGIRNGSNKTIRNIRVKVLSMTHVMDKGLTSTVPVDLPTTIGTIAEVHPSNDMHTEHVSFLTYGQPRHPEMDEAWLLTATPVEIEPTDYFGKLRIEAEDTQPFDLSFRVHFSGGRPVLHIG